MSDLLLPRTDAGVAAQLALLALVGTAGLITARRRPEMRIFVVGVTAALAGLLGVRAIH